MTIFFRACTFFILSAICTTGAPLVAVAQSVNELENKISKQEQEIEAIEEEIEQYEQQLTGIRREKQTLESAVRELDVSRRKVNASINLAQHKIDRVSATIRGLSTDIDVIRQRIETNQHALAETIRSMHVAESESLVEVVLQSDDISSVWQDIESLQQFQLMVRDEVNELADQKTNLESVRVQEKAAQEELVAQRAELAAQKRALDINRQAKKELLAETENRESSYQELIAEKRRAKKEFESQLRSFEEQLQYILDPSSIPPAGKGVLSWPVANARITQYFGNTQFAKSGAYNGQGHNGIDFGTSIGTPIKSSLAGNVKATGNTDAIRGCYSYGKWVLVEHVNGLATLYAHLSDINVAPGQSVGTGEIIAYSGNTGYSTGPHLHLTVYAGDAVKVVRLGDIKTRTNCADAEIPVAAWEGYLNPLDYLN